MKKFMKASLSFAIAGMMALSMFTAGTKTTANAEDTAASTWTVSKSKTATALDTNNQTQVTLSLPSAEEKLTSDVLFVMDVSQFADGADKVIENLMNQLNTQITANHASVRVGLVIFKGNAQVACDLTDYTTGSDEILSKAKIFSEASDKLEHGTDPEKAEATATFNEIVPKLYLHGSNLPAGLACAEEVLDGDNVVTEASRKHLVLISDGATYLFCDGNGETDATKNQFDYTDHLTRVTTVGKTSGAVGTLSELEHKYSENYNWDPTVQYGTWAKYLSISETDNANEGMDKYDQDYYATDMTNLLPSTDTSNSQYNAVINVDKSFYEAADIYKKLQGKGYDCNAYLSTNVGSLFTSFMNYIAGGTAKDISKINNDIFYMLSAGSSIYDEMGTGTDYAFSFVNDPAQLKLTVDGTAYTAKSVAATNGETAVYEF